MLLPPDISVYVSAYHARHLIIYLNILTKFVEFICDYIKLDLRMYMENQRQTCVKI